MLASFVEYVNVHVARVRSSIRTYHMCIAEEIGVKRESIIPTWPWLTFFNVIDSGLRVESIFTGAGEYIVRTEYSYKYIDRAGQEVSSHRKEIEQVPRNKLTGITELVSPKCHITRLA